LVGGEITIMSVRRGLIWAATVAGCIAALIALKVFMMSADRPDRSAGAYTIARNIQYGFTLQNTTNRVVKKAEFWTYAPVKQTSAQLCTKIQASHSYRLLTDELGNQILHFTFQNLPPFASKIITIQADLLFTNNPASLPVKNITSYLQPEKYIEIQDPAIQELSDQFKSSNAVKTAEQIFNWVAAHIQYAGYVKNSRGARYALANRKGDCTEYMYLFAALSRANNIPVRCIGGYLCTESTILKPGSYHNWAEFYENSTWRLADPQNKVFDKAYAHYVAMRIIQGAREDLMRGFNRFRVDGDGLKAKMHS
jgi:transglutaminase-like putative cysteine protease